MKVNYLFEYLIVKVIGMMDHQILKLIGPLQNFITCICININLTLKSVPTWYDCEYFNSSIVREYNFLLILCYRERFKYLFVYYAHRICGCNTWTARMTAWLLNSRSCITRGGERYELKNNKQENVKQMFYMYGFHT
jgi:hypothetical protein